MIVSVVLTLLIILVSHYYYSRIYLTRKKMLGYKRQF